MSECSVIRIPERGSVVLHESQWREVSLNTDFWKLVERGVIAVEQSRAGQVRLAGSCYVGRARIDERYIIEVHEKIEGSLAALVRHASAGSFRYEPLSGPSTGFGPLIELVAVRFVDAVRKYVTRGRRFRYEKQRATGSLVGGRLDVTRTLGLRARGLRHMVAFERQATSHALPENSLLLAALREIERLSTIAVISSDALVRSRGMAMLFDDCRQSETLLASRHGSARMARELAATTTDEVLADALAMAAVLLSHESVEPGASPIGRSPEAWFLNLENLFEAAVRNCLDAAAKTCGHRVTSAGADRRRVFGDSDYLRAQPDLVVRNKRACIAAIGDVKYKHWAGTATSSDIYQLLVHAAAFEVGTAFLVFPASGFQVSEYGDAVTGAHVSVYGVDVNSLSEHVSRIMLAIAAGCTP